MQAKYDFSKGKRGKHVGKRVRIVGDKRSNKRAIRMTRIKQAVDSDLRRCKSKR